MSISIAAKTVRLAGLVAFAVLVAEAGAFLGFNLFATERLAIHWRVETNAALSELTPVAIQRFQEQFYDPVLGWVFHEKTTVLPYAQFDANGARVDVLAGAPGVVAAYGDSFTFGEDVENDETWPHFLAEALGVQVANFGVAGYGPDQALLRLRGHLEEGRVPEVVILGVMSENIARVVNVWRKVYTGGEALNFKPVLVVDQGVPRWVPNPLGQPVTVESVRQAIKNSSPNDFWADQNQRRPAVPHFPYLVTAFDTLTYLSFRVVRWQDLWQQDQPLEVLRAIVAEFVLLSQTYSFDPVILMIPMAEDLRFHEANQPATYAHVLEEFRREYEGQLVVVDTLDEDFEASRYQLRPYQGHTSAYGNQVISAAIVNRLSAFNVVP